MQESCLVMVLFRYVGGETSLGRENHKYWLEMEMERHHGNIAVCTDYVLCELF